MAALFSNKFTQVLTGIVDKQQASLLTEVSRFINKIESKLSRATMDGDGIRIRVQGVISDEAKAEIIALYTEEAGWAVVDVFTNDKQTEFVFASSVIYSGNGFGLGEYYL